MVVTMADGFTLTPRSVAYPLTEEGYVPEAYKDAGGVWTVFGGIATTSGYNVLQWKDKPATLDAGLRATIDFMRERFLPDVARTFAGHALTEAQLAAALSFHWNTGAIGKAQWVKDFLGDNVAAARIDIMQWASHGQLTARRVRERSLFFDGVWPSMNVPIYAVAKPSYRPVTPRTIDVVPVLQSILGGQ
jgi:lysozyme